MRAVVVVPDERRGDPAVLPPVDEAGIVLDEPLDNLLVEIAPAVAGPDAGLGARSSHSTLPATRLGRGCFSGSTAGSWRSCSPASCSGRRPSGSWRARRSAITGDVARAVRRRPGRAPDARRAAPRVRPRDGGGALRGAPGSRRRRRQRDRHRVPPGPDTARADALGARCGSIRGTRTRASALSHSVPGSADAKRAIAAESQIQRRLWSLAGQSLAAQPIQSAPRLYVESLNEMIDMQTTRVSRRSTTGFRRRSPSSRCSGPRPRWR